MRRDGPSGALSILRPPTTNVADDDWKVGDVCTFEHREETLVGFVHGVDTALDVYAPRSMRPGDTVVFNWRVPKAWATRFVKAAEPK